MSDVAFDHPASRRRQRLVEAMGLGPLWTLRSVVEVVDRPDGEPPVAIAAMDLDALAAAVRTCRACPLCEFRTHAVPGDGAAAAPWVVVGPAPSADDDAAGAPLTGQPGRLLEAMLASVDRSRQRDVFVTTAVKCRPPGGRAPSAVELEACRPYLERQITLLQPRLLIALGETIAHILSDAMGAKRGTLGNVTIDGRETPAIATHHPDTMLAEPLLKAEAWADLCIARSV